MRHYKNDAEIASKRLEVEGLGGEVLYLQSDICSGEQVQRAATLIRQRFGVVHGVIHSALVLRDRTLGRMSEAEFLAALEVKELGSVLLEESFGREAELDFILYFSSVQSQMAGAGQGNYAAGCTFADAYARAQEGVGGQKGRRVVLNWGYWGSVGAVSSQTYRQGLERRGLRSIEAGEGMELVERVLAQELSQVVVIRASEEILSQIGVERSCQWQVVNDVAGEVAGRELRAGAEEVVRESQKGMELEQSGEAFALLERYGLLLLLEAFQRMGVLQRAGEEYEYNGLRERLGIVEGYGALFKELLGLLTRAGYVEVAGVKLRATEGVGQSVVEQERRELEERLAQRYPMVGPHVELLKSCLQAYPQILRGQLNALAALFPAGDMEQVEKIHAGEGLLEIYGRLQARLVSSYVQARLKQQPDQVLNIVEVGAGTGGSSAYVLAALQPYQKQVQYLYTDVSRSFLEHGRKRFASVYGPLRFALLNVEEDPLGQGHAAGSVDLILGSNVLHATRRIERTLTELKKLLKRNGVLLLTELTRLQSFATMTFGLTEGWWRFEDPTNRLAGSPLLSQKRWLQLLSRTGYKVLFTQALGQNPPDPTQDPPQTLFFAQSDGLIPITRSATPALSVQTNSKSNEARQQTDNAEAHNSGHVKGLKITPLSSGLEKVIEYTMAVFAEVLKIAKDQFNAGATFETYGVDSLMALELSKRLEKDLGKLPSTLLFEYSSIEALSRYLFETHRERLGELLQLEVSPRLSTPVRDTENGRDQVATAEPEEMRWSGGKIASLDTLVDSLSVRELDSLLSILGNRAQ